MTQLAVDLNNLNTQAAVQTSQGLIVQQYCTSILQQPDVDFSDLKDLASGQKLVEIGDKINEALTEARRHANNYLKNTRPKIITNLTSIEAYTNLHSSIPTVLSGNKTEEEWLRTLKAIEDQARGYQAASKGVSDDLRQLHSDLSEIAGTFNGLTSDLNAQVEGDEGALKEIQDNLDSINEKIAGAIAGIALGGLAVAGGIFVVAVGSIATFVTAGTSAWVVAGGVAMIAAGAGGVVGGSIALVGLLDQQNEQLKRKANLNNQVRWAKGAEANLEKISSQTKEAAEAALNMSNAWASLGGNLGNLAGDLQRGRTNTGILRELFLTTANDDVVDVKNGVATIKQQLAGVNVKVLPDGGNVIAFANETIHRLAA